MGEHPLGKVARVAISPAQSRNELLNPCAVATRPAVSLFAFMRRRNDVSNMSLTTLPARRREYERLRQLLFLQLFDEYERRG